MGKQILCIRCKEKMMESMLFLLLVDVCYTSLLCCYSVCWCYSHVSVCYISSLLFPSLTPAHVLQVVILLYLLLSCLLVLQSCFSVLPHVVILVISVVILFPIVILFCSTVMFQHAVSLYYLVSMFLKLCYAVS